MFNAQDDTIKRGLLVGDVFLIVLAYFLAFDVRDFIREFYHHDLLPGVDVLPRSISIRTNLIILPLIVPIFLYIFHLSGVYHYFRRQRYLDIVWMITSSVLLGTGLLGAVMFALHIEGVSRSLLIVFAVLCTCFLAAIRILIQNSLRRAWKQGKNCKNILVVGTGPRAVAFAQRLEKYKEWGYRITGFIDEEVQNGRIQQYPVTQGLEKLPSLLRNEVVDIVAFVVPRSWLERIGSYIRQCELLGKDVAIQVDLYDHSIGHVHLADMAGLPVLQFETAVREGWQVIIKRWVDILVSGILIVLLSPLLLFIALLIKKVSPGGPVFYRQIRCGMNGRTFQLLKFRSMVPNADKMQKELAHLNESSGPVFKITKDPRLIPYGGFLRKFSLDELPQLFNVFKGDMSLVGPRPPIPHEVEEYDDWQRRKLSVRPGITCLWQVSGRNKISFEDWMRLDLQYIDSWSLWLDLKILLRTIPVVIAGTGK